MNDDLNHESPVTKPVNDVWKNLVNGVEIAFWTGDPDDSDPEYIELLKVAAMPGAKVNATFQSDGSEFTAPVASVADGNIIAVRFGGIVPSKGIHLLVTAPEEDLK